MFGQTRDKAARTAIDHLAYELGREVEFDPDDATRVRVREAKYLSSPRKVTHESEVRVMDHIKALAEALGYHFEIVGAEPRKIVAVKTKESERWNKKTRKAAEKALRKRTK